MGDQESPQIEIGHRGFEKDMPIFYVKDNGVGIQPQFHENIFGLFNKLDVHSEGTGVGLALVKRIIEVTAAGSGSRARPAKAARSFSHFQGE